MGCDEKELDVSIAERLSRVPTSHVCDALVHLGYRNVVLEGLRPISEQGLSIAGPAATIELVRARTNNDQRRIGAFLDEVVDDGQVVVVAAHGICDYVAVGGRAAARARTVGAAGMIVDGGVRDLPELRGNQFLVHARGAGLGASEGHLEGIRINEPVWCAGVKIAPGDYVVADDSGVVVIPAEVVETIVDLAEERDEVDKETMAAIATGATIAETHRHFRDDDVAWYRHVE
jgi:4-hydroxy-4-methyl-2-oxoglutarate aldolase